MIKIKISQDKKLKNEIDIRLTKFNREKSSWLKNKSINLNDEYTEEELNLFVYDDKKLIGIRTDTWDFQAKGFYEKVGFKLFGELNIVL